MPLRSAAVNCLRRRLRLGLLRYVARRGEFGTACGKSVEQKRRLLHPFCSRQVAYPAIIQSAFGSFACTELADGSRALSLAPHLDCDSDEAHVAQSVAAASLAVWGVCFPILLGLLIHRKASDPRFSFVIVSYGYKVNFRHWEALECMKKFGILLIITVLQFSPELAATALLVFLICALIITAESAPFVSSLINKAHLACDFLVFLMLLTGLLTHLLSTCAGRTWPKHVDNLSIVVVSYATSLLAALAIIFWLETGSIFHKGGKRHAMWDKFVQSNPVM